MMKRPRVALLVESSRAYGRGALLGIAEYVKARGPWSIYLMERGLDEAPPAWLKGWRGDGAIARADNRRMARAVRDLGVPAVDLSGVFDDLEMPCVATDEKAIARLAFDHLFERGLRRFAYCGFPGLVYSDQRAGHFVRMAEDAGLACHVFRAGRGPHALGTEAHEQRGWMFEIDLVQWIEALPRPIGLMACNDIRAQQVLTSCRAVGVAVPEEVAVVGVDDDEILCELADPPLSSVLQDTRRIGCEAAALLDRMMNGEAVAERSIVVAPLRVVPRRSTDVLAIDDREIAAAVHFIRDHACDPISVEDLLAVVPFSRSVFERRFIRAVGIAPKAAILRARLDHVKRLLADTELSMKQVAFKTGFQHPEYLNAAFKKMTGQTPGAYRRAFRERAPRDHCRARR